MILLKEKTKVVGWATQVPHPTTLFILTDLSRTVSTASIIDYVDIHSLCHLFSFGLVTLPLILRTTRGLSTALLVTVMVLVKPPTLLVLYFTLIVPVLPGMTGSFVHEGVVQPQEARTLERIKGSVPVLVKVKTQLPSPPLTICP